MTNQAISSLTVSSKHFVLQPSIIRILENEIRSHLKAKDSMHCNLIWSRKSSWNTFSFSAIHWRLISVCSHLSVPQNKDCFRDFITITQIYNTNQNRRYSQTWLNNAALLLISTLTYQKIATRRYFKIN